MAAGGPVSRRCAQKLGAMGARRRKHCAIGETGANRGAVCQTESSHNGVRCQGRRQALWRRAALLGGPSNPMCPVCFVWRRVGGGYAP